MWRAIEPIHAVTYFADACRTGPAALGLKGFWHGYFANRAAPMGRVGAEVVIATFFNFHPDMVRRALPSAWEIVAPAVVCQARVQAAATVLADTVHNGASLVALIDGPLQGVIDRADGAGRALFAANRELGRPVGLDQRTAAVGALWQQCTVLREHRGDGHVQALLAHDMGACTTHVLFAASNGLPGELLRVGRGWSDDEWSEATEELVERQLIDAHGATPEGLALRAEVERQTDALAARPYESLDDDELGHLLDRLGTIADAVLSSGIINFPNPMGLPGPSRTVDH